MNKIEKKALHLDMLLRACMCEIIVCAMWGCCDDQGRKLTEL